MPGFKYIIILLSLVVSLFAKDIVVYNNEYNILKLDKKIKKLVVGNRDAINVSVLSSSREEGTLLKIFGKKTGSTSILVIYKDGTMQNYHVYINENLGFVQKMINVIEPNLQLSKVGDGSTVISGSFENPHDKSSIFALLESAGVDMKHLMDLTQTKKVNKMVRTKLYLVEINNNKAKDLGGVTGMSFFNEYVAATLNPLAANGATFSGWLLDNMGDFTAKKGKSVSGTLNFLEQSGIGKILDDTVLITTEDKNASFRVGGEVYIPTGMTQNAGLAPTIEL
jgi:Flp pilus assembly secretin CpaC